MSAAEVVAKYPGGGAVLAAARKVEKANSGAITAAAQRLTQAGTNAGEHGTGVANSVKTLDSEWKGASADQFVAYMDRFAKAGTASAEALAKAGAALGKVAGAIEDAKHFVANRCEQVLGEIKRAVQRNPDADQAQIDAAIMPLTAAAATDIENKLKETDAQLKAAASEITAAANPGATFTDVPEPGSQAYVPGPGKTIDWKPEEVAKDQGTNPANTDAKPTAQPASTHSGGGSGGSSGGGGGGGGMGPSGGPPAGPPPGNVQDWIKQALEILRANGINVSEADVPKIWAIIQHESSGNPNAQNLWDSNAAKGTPSKGLMQCIDPTFNSYKMPGHNNVWDPVQNICAGVNYAISRYGSLDNVPGIKAMAGGGAYRGY
ncbi:transglycosylase SLT domain-containing protein [Kibdelosporangium philippinense]|uniref:Transglycosylase SLT domain-containing protein n=1 Tax=Kibdelosporangium philippinense TaxID=211113 RepID=A0ABS8ZHJ3_9PSEU|nr:transglycosylase SLT domain-containing protein [Kibdelosporangium philippinense]MCE7005307.1 transglycosylase SLT domain-containing protein [Kibdelosporangium philippinense]